MEWYVYSATVFFEVFGASVAILTLSLSILIVSQTGSFQPFVRAQLIGIFCVAWSYEAIILIDQFVRYVLQYNIGWTKILTTQFIIITLTLLFFCISAERIFALTFYKRYSSLMSSWKKIAISSGIFVILSSAVIHVLVVNFVNLRAVFAVCLMVDLMTSIALIFLWHASRRLRRLKLSISLVSKYQLWESLRVSRLITRLVVAALLAKFVTFCVVLVARTQENREERIAFYRLSRISMSAYGFSTFLILTYSHTHYAQKLNDYISLILGRDCTVMATHHRSHSTGDRQDVHFGQLQQQWQCPSPREVSTS